VTNGISIGAGASATMDDSVILGKNAGTGIEAVSSDLSLFRRALIAAAQRGVAVTLLLQGRVEYLLLHYATRALYGQLLSSGITIQEYHRSFLHAKVAVVDDHWATVGSSNIDPLSLLLAREANVFVDDAVFARQLCGSLEEAMRTGGARLAPRRWREQSLLTRLRIWIGYGIARALISLVGFERYH